ncbi:MAG: tetratricopeptide repeat protein [Gammaproteobacteria bacterium]|nr:tetratricopeptide repeat protein [Gammaproteobacteria bacterium]
MPTEIEQQLQAGIEHHRAGRLRDAENAYRSILADDPKQADALNLLGIVALQSGNAPDATGLFEAAVESRPDNPEFHNMLGEARRMSGEPDLAEASYKKALELNPQFAGGHNNLANLYLQLDRLDDAIHHYRAAIQGNPRFPMSYNNLGSALRRAGQLDEARDAFNKAIELLPNYAEAFTGLGLVHEALDQLDDAITSHRKAVALNPSFAEGHGNLGNALRVDGQLDEARVHYARSVELNPGDAVAHYNLGIAHDELGRPDEAIANYEKALELDAGHAEAHNNLGNALDQVGRHEEAVAHYETAIELKPDYAEARRNVTRLRPEDSQIAALEKMLEEPTVAGEDAVHCHYALGNIHHRAKRYDEAFTHYQQANDLKRARIQHNASAYSEFVDSLIEFYSAERFRDTGASGSSSDAPVFVLGMPRSGTTLVEQILSSHGEVHGAGELATLGDIELELALRFQEEGGYPSCVGELSASELEQMAARYLQDLTARSGSATRVTDKMPSNFARIGLIKMLLPQARIVHCVREPLDTCLSNYFHYFAVGNEFACRFEELAAYYADYRRLMAHWKSVFPDAIVDVAYEDVVSDQEGTSRQLVNALGLDWDPNCLRFHENKRAVNTFNSLQVRQPIYTKAVGRWQVYETQLAPLISALREAGLDDVGRHHE